MCIGIYGNWLRAVTDNSLGFMMLADAVTYSRPSYGQLTAPHAHDSIPWLSRPLSPSTYFRCFGAGYLHSTYADRTIYN